MSSARLRLAVGALALLPFELVAKLTLALAAAIFIAAPFELARVYAVATVFMVQLLAKAHRAWYAGRWQPPGRLRYRVIYHEGRVRGGWGPFVSDGEMPRSTVEPISTGELLLSPGSTADQVISEVNGQRDVSEAMATQTTVANECGTTLRAGSALMLADLHSPHAAAGALEGFEVGAYADVTLHAFLGYDFLGRYGARREASRSRPIIFVRNAFGKEVQLPFQPDLSVLECMLLLHEAEGVPPAEQRLVFAGKQLEAYRTLEEYGVCSGGTLHLSIRPHSGPNAAATES